MVWLALEQLGKVDLLESRVEAPREAAAVSRRSFMRTVGIGVVGGAVVLPLVTSIVAPTPAHAASVRTCCQNENGCNGGICGPTAQNCNCNNSLQDVVACPGTNGKSCCVQNGKLCNINLDCCNKTCSAGVCT
jgi:hypothetical protein